MPRSTTARRERCRSWSAALRSTSVPCWTTSSSRAPTPPYAAAGGGAGGVGAEPLHARLAGSTRRPRSSSLPSNGRRIVRALEVVQITGGPFRASLPRLDYADPTACRSASTCRPAAGRPHRAARRPDVGGGPGGGGRRLLAAGLRHGRTASRALGYAQVLAHLAGDCADEARERPSCATRRFARRQDTWFRSDPRIVWLPYDAPDLPSRRSTPYDPGSPVSFPFVKGHGTRNDFVLLPDLDGTVHGDLSRRAGARAVRPPCRHRRRRRAAGAARRPRDERADAPWFMDYRNADGSVVGDVRQRHPGLRPLPGRGRPGRRRAVRSVDTRDGVKPCCATARSASTWAGRGSSASQVSVGDADLAGHARRHGQPACGRLRRRRDTLAGST